MIPLKINNLTVLKSTYRYYAHVILYLLSIKSFNLISTAKTISLHLGGRKQSIKLFYKMIKLTNIHIALGIRCFLPLILIVLLSGHANSQVGGLGVNDLGSPADPSAMLDISSNKAGLLIPRMTTTERDNNIVNPAVGLLIFNTSTMCFEYWAYGIWQTLSCAVCPLPAAPGNISGSSGVCAGNNNISYSIPVIAGSVSYVWAYSGTGAVINGTGTTINIDFSSNASSGNITVKGVNSCGDGPVSAVFPVTVGNVPVSPTAGSHITTQTQIEWQWNSVSQATGYKYNTVNNYSTAINTSTATSFTQTSLPCNTNSTLYVWAYNSCGNSAPLLLNASTTACYICGSSNVTFTYNGGTVVYGTVSGNYNGGQYCWMDRNLGASAVATAVNHSAAYGDLFQWGRGADGHHLRSNSSTTTTLSTTDVPGHSIYIAALSPPYDWRSGQNNALWQGVSGINNPCPSGWRLPTDAEFNNERTTWSSNGGNNTNGAFQCNLRLTPAGHRFYSNAAINDVGSYGSYWCSTVSGTNAQYLNFYSGNANLIGNIRGQGLSIRCIKD